MEKIKKSGAVFQNNNPDSQSSQFSFTDLSTHLFAAFASHDCPSPLFLDENFSDDDPYSISTSYYDQPYKSLLVGNKQLSVPPGKILLQDWKEKKFFVGFEHNSDALAAAEIEQKMAKFELEPIMNNEQPEEEEDDQ